MRSPRLRRPSPALVVAVLALVVALGGSAYAVGRINGSTIKPRSIPGDRIRNKALTGTQINVARLGRVNEAKNANNSKFALRASAAASSANALNAGNARNADALSGNPAGAFQTRVRWALVSSGSVIAQSGGFGAVTHVGGSTYVVDFGASVAGKALLVTPNGTGGTAVAAAPCGGGVPGSTNTCPASVSDANHVQVVGAGAFYIAAIG